MSRAPLRVAVLGAGTVGLEVIRAFAAFPDRLAPADGAPLSLVGVAVRDLDRARARGVPADLLTDAPAHLVASPEVDVDRRGHGRRRAGPDADRGGARRRQAGRHREQARRRPSRPRARGDRPADRGGAPVRGRGRRRDPDPRPARRRARRRPDRRACAGIVNGTTNHILTAMASGGRAYADVLAEAQAAGYAEADPSGDVEGDDAVNKLVDPGPARVRGLARARLDRAAAADGRRRRRARDHRGDRRRAQGRGRRRPDAQAAGRGAPARRRVDRARPSCRRPSRRQPARPDGRRPEPDRDRRRSRSAGWPSSGPGAGGPATSSAVLGDLIAIARGGSSSTWAGLRAGRPAAAERAAADDEPRRRFFATTLPEQLVRDQVEIELREGRRVHRRGPPARRAPGRPGRRRRRRDALPGRRDDRAAMASPTDPRRALPPVPAGHRRDAGADPRRGLHPARPRPAARRRARARRTSTSRSRARTRPAASRTAGWSSP